MQGSYLSVTTITCPFGNEYLLNECKCYYCFNYYKIWKTLQKTLGRILPSTHFPLHPLLATLTSNAHACFCFRVFALAAPSAWSSLRHPHGSSHTHSSLGSNLNFLGTLSLTILFKTTVPLPIPNVPTFPAQALSAF